MQLLQHEASTTYPHVQHTAATSKCGFLSTPEEYRAVRCFDGNRTIRKWFAVEDWSAT